MRNKAARLILIGALVCAPVPAAAQAALIADASRHEAAKPVLAAVLLYAAGLARGPRAICVAIDTAQQLRAERLREPMRAAAAEASAAALAASGPGAVLSDPPSRWLRPVYPGPDLDGTERVDPALARMLDAQLDVALRASGPRLFDWIDPDMVPPPLRSEFDTRNCQTFRLSAPAFAGDVAFVESATSCASLCSTEALYALMRRDGRWTIVAVDFTWIG